MLKKEYNKISKILIEKIEMINTTKEENKLIFCTVKIFIYIHRIKYMQQNLFKAESRGLEKFFRTMQYKIRNFPIMLRAKSVFSFNKTLL